MDDEIARAILARKGSPQLNSAQAAFYLGISLKTLQRLRRDGEGPAFRKIGWCIRYHIDELKAWDKATSAVKLKPKSPKVRG